MQLQEIIKILQEDIIFYLTSMNQQFLQQIYQKPCKVNQLYCRYKQEQNKHSSKIVKVQCNQNLFFTSYAKIPKTFGDDDYCTIFLFEVGGSIILGYSTKTKGFPFTQQIPPLMKHNISLDQIYYLELKENQFQIKAKQKSDNSDQKWEFLFQNNLVKQKWFMLIVYLRYCSKTKREYNIELLIDDDKSNNNLIKQQTNYQTKEKKGRKKQLKYNIEQHSKQITFLQQSLQTQGKDLEKRTRENSQLKREIQRLKKISFSQKQSETIQLNKSLQSTIQNLTKTIIFYSTENQSLKNQIQKLKENQSRELREFKQIEKNYCQSIEHLTQLLQTKDAQVSQQKHSLQQIMKSKNQSKSGQQDKLIGSQKAQIEEFSKILALKQLELVNKTQELQQSKNKIELYSQSEKQLLQKIQTLQGELIQEKKTIQNKAVIYIQFQSQKQEMLKNIKKLTEELLQQRQKIQQTNRINAQNDEKKDKQIKELKNKLQEIVKRYKDMQQSLKKERQTSNTYKKENKKKQSELYQLEEKYNQIGKQFESFKQQSEAEKYRMHDEINQLREVISADKKKSESQQKILKESLKQAKDEILSIKGQNQRLLHQNQRLLQQSQKVSTWMQQLQITKSRLQKLNKFNLLHIFQGDILEDKQQYKAYLKESIQTYKNKKILKTKKIYTLEKDVKTDFHKYADEIPQIAVLVKTDAGFYLAGYSQSPISTKTVANKGGLIMSLNNKKHFTVIPGKRSVTYDTYFLIIGNSEIRLKNQEWKVFSNFGIANSFFNSMGCGVNDLLGEGPAVRQVKIVTFEIHQIIYE